MTDRTQASGPAGHLDADELADLQEGLLEPGPARAAEEHLLGCPSCSADRRVLAGVPDRLAAAGAVGPMPAEVARRLEAALAAQPPVPAAAAATVTPLAARADGPRRVRGMRVLQAAALLIVVLAGVGVAITARGGGSDSSSSTAGAAKDSAAQELPAAGGVPVTTSGRGWTEDTVVAAVPELLAGSLGAGVPSAASAEPDDDARAESRGTAPELAGSQADRLAGGPALTACVLTLAGEAVTPLAVDLATWAGKPAAVIVLPTPEDPATVDLYVVQPSCPPGEFLFFAREARP